MNVHRAGIAGLLLCAVLVAAPASAQVDFSGEWAPRLWEDQPERVPGPELFDYSGIPVSEAARLRAAAWEASLQTLPEWQCRPHTADYIWRGPSNLKVSKEVDPISREIVGFHAEWLRSVDRPIYLDARPRPDEDALHTWGGFTKAKWDGDVLTTTVTHLKEGYLRRNGLPRSDKATLTEHWIRNGDILTVMVTVHDPVYLTEPFVRTTDYELDLRQQVPPYPCGVVQEVDRAKHEVPHHLPGTNPYSTEFAQRHGIPVEAGLGGAETMYPDYQQKLRTMKILPPLQQPPAAQQGQPRPAGAQPARPSAPPAQQRPAAQQVQPGSGSGRGRQ